jgi:AcrR family transcriptional regulator
MIRTEVKQATRGTTAALLIDAAAKEFQEHGYEGTDTNRIARRAGFAPQTFYRWFRDKNEIFVAVYNEWVHELFERLRELSSRGATDSEFIDAVIAHHRANHIFRRSLRRLTVENKAVRKARAASRLEQVKYIKERYRPLRLSTADVAVFLLQYERLCDALADNEFEDLGVEEDVVKSHLEDLYKRLRKEV